MSTKFNPIQIVDYINDPVFTINKKSFLIQYINHEGEAFFKKSNELLIKKHLDIIFPKRSIMNDFIEKSLFRFGNYIFSDVELLVEQKSKIVNIDIVNSEKLDFLIICIKNKKNLINRNNEHDLFFFENLFSILCHELKNPLSSIKMASQLLEKKKIDNELTEIIINECNRIRDLIDSFQVNVIEEQSTDGKINIHEIIRYVIKKLKLKDLKKIQIIEEFDPSLPLINLSKNKLIIILDNLIENSINFRNHIDSYIKIKTSFVFGGLKMIPGIKSNSKNNYIKIIIEDNGSGISKPDLKLVFYPFFTTRQEGKGIGLFLVKKIIKHFGGYISVSSDTKKTQFEILLPVD